MHRTHPSPAIAPIEPRALRRPDAARVLGISIRTLDRMLARGEIRKTRIGRGVRIRVAEIERYLAEREEATACSGAA